MKEYSNLPSTKTEAEQCGVRCIREIELAIAYEAFRAEFIRVFVQLGVMHASPKRKRMPMSVK